MSKPIHVLISGAAGQIGYSLIPLVATGQAFGVDQTVILHLLDIPRAEKALHGVCMEIVDGGYPLVEHIIPSTDYDEAFKDVQYCFLVGGFPRLKGMQRKDLLDKNKAIFEATGKALEAHADRNVKVLVVANPANTNALVASLNAPSIPKENFSALTRLDHNRATSQVSERIQTAARNVSNVIIWGNHSSTQVPDLSHAVVTTDGKAESVVSKLSAKDQVWADTEFISTVQGRGSAIIAARGLSSAMSAANAAKDHMRDWVQGTKEGQWVSMGIVSTGHYGIAKDIVFSFPVTIKDGKYTVVEGLTSSDAQKKLIKATEAELVEEKQIAGY